MAYSRWSTSKWYTYWSCYSGATKDEQVLVIDGDFDFTYEQLTANLDNCMSLVKEKHPDYQQKDFEELKQYINNFIEHVDEVFSLTNPPKEFTE